MKANKQTAKRFCIQNSFMFNEKIVADKIGNVVVHFKLAGVTEKNHFH